MSSNFAIYDWPTQLAVFKAMYNTNDLCVKYLDDENEEVTINSQEDLEYAYQIGLNSQNNVLKLILRNSRNELIARQNLNLDLKIIKMIKNKQKENELVECLKSSKILADLQKSKIEFSTEQIKWLDEYLDKFRTNLVKDIDEKINRTVQKALADKEKISNTVKDDLISFDLVDIKEPNLDKRVKKLFSLIAESRLTRRALKTAYLEEELLSLGAFSAEFIKDFNLPDGSRCEPDVKFQKTWLIKNTGKLDWDSSEFQVKLICIAGNINTANGLEYVNVENTKINQTAEVSVELIAPSQSGNYFSEWVLCCNGFQFGPRIWCSINVGSDEMSQSIIERPLLRNSFPMSISRISSIQGQNDLKNFQSDDLDDEFVVVPDCFDLTKKWQPQTEKLDEDHSTPVNELISLNETKSDEQPTEELFDETPKQELTNEISNVNSKTQPESSGSESIEIVSNSRSNSGSDKSVLSVISSSPTITHQQIANAFDMMKNAFSNLGRPSYVGSIDLVDKKPSIDKSDNESINNEDKMKKLISMGFASRAINQRLLEKHNYDLDTVVQKLLEMSDNDWMERR